jgi:hypothetical protein
MNQEVAKHPVNWWLVILQIVIIFLSALVIFTGLNIEMPCLR